MADKTAEQMSAVMDGECEAGELAFALHRLTKDSNLKVAWQRYHIIRDAIKSNLPDSIDGGFPERIKQLIDNESAPHGRIVTPGFSWFKPVAGFAVAASVALVITLLTLRETEFGDGLSSGLAGNVNQPSAAVQTSATLVIEEQALPPQLNSYLVNHNGYASMTTVYGVLPYARMVGYETEQ